MLFRLLQGVFGAALVPLSQAIMADAYPPHERGKAMAIWGLGVMVGPVAGPTLGGWLTDIAQLALDFLHQSAGRACCRCSWRRSSCRIRARRPRRMDWFGFGFMAIGIAGLQYVFDRGNQQDWFEALDIRYGALAAFVGIAVFIVHSLRRPESGDLRHPHLRGPQLRHVFAGDRAAWASACSAGWCCSPSCSRGCSAIPSSPPAC